MDSVPELQKSVHELALAVRELVTELKLGQQRQNEKNIEASDRVTELERVIWKNNGNSYATRLIAVEKLAATVAAKLKAAEERKAGIADNVTGAVIIKGIIVVLGLAAAGAGYALLRSGS